MVWTIKVSGCDISALNDTNASSYDLDAPLTPVDKTKAFYTRAATHRSIPATITITDVSQSQQTTGVRQVEITTKVARWSLYYKEVTSDNKRATFNDGTVFTVDSSGATLTVTKCIRGLNGTYTKSADPLVDGTTVYSIAGSSAFQTDIPRSVSCNWGKRVFSIGVDAYTVECGERTFTMSTGVNRDPVSIGAHAPESGPDKDRQPNARLAFANTVEPVCTKTNSWHPFAKELPFIVTTYTAAGNKELREVLTPLITCHANSVASTSIPNQGRACVKGRWRVPVGGEDVLHCTPGPNQKFINVSGFTRAEAIFNGAYEHEQDARASTTTWPVWTHTTNKLTRIEISETEGNTLELRDTSYAVGYTIKIIKSTNPSTNPTLEVYDKSQAAQSPSIIITAAFSAAEVALKPCDLWSQCVEANMDTSKPDGSTLLVCADHARGCAASRPVAFSLTILKTSAGAADIKILPIVTDDPSGALFGRGAGISGTSAATTAATTAATAATTTTTTTTAAAAATTVADAAAAFAVAFAALTLYVVIPTGAAVNGQKAKVLVIPPTGSAVVRDATLAMVTGGFSIVTKTWTIDAAAPTERPTAAPTAAPTERPAAPTERPAAPTAAPTAMPTAAPTAAPTAPTVMIGTSEVPCADLLKCLSSPTAIASGSLGFSACAASAVSCAASSAIGGLGGLGGVGGLGGLGGQRVLSGDRLVYDNKPTVELYRLSTVLYGTDKDNAYVIVHGDVYSTKGKLLVAPLTNGAALVVDVEKLNGSSAWTVVADNTTMWIIIGVVGGILLISMIILAAVLVLRKRSKVQSSYRPSSQSGFSKRK